MNYVSLDNDSIQYLQLVDKQSNSYYNEYIFSEWVVIIGVRSEGKLNTRKLILKQTALLLHEKGFLRVSSKEIASQCGLSQGSLFLHFETKENLLNTILNGNIETFESELLNRCQIEDTNEHFLRNYLDVLIENESFISRAYKDLPYLSAVMTKNISNLETLSKNLFFDNIRHNAADNLSIVDSFIAIDAFLSQVQKNLLDKEIYTEYNSVIKQKKGKLIKLYKILFE